MAMDVFVTQKLNIEVQTVKTNRRDKVLADRRNRERVHFEAIEGGRLIADNCEKGAARRTDRRPGSCKSIEGARLRGGGSV